jgi:FecR protein
MPAPRVGLREFAFLLITALIALPLAANAADDPAEIGVVDKVENEANIVSSHNATAAVGTPVHMRDELRTGAEGRLKITFRDETVLTLGEKASVVIDRYVYDPDRQVGEAILQATKGAFRFATGRIKAMKGSKIARLDPGRRYRRARHRVLGRADRRTIWGAAARG